MSGLCATAQERGPLLDVWRENVLAQATGGRWLAPLRSPVDSVSVDSRAVQPGQAFFAIRGQRLDGHDFLEEAALRGATLLVVDDRARAARALAELASPPATLLVPDARRALGAIAAARRASTLACAQLVAVTGSNGKTTTCRMLEAALAAAAPTHASPRSFNNDIGLPLTLLNAPAQSVFLVCEIGANAPGEIAQLGAIATPDVAVALNASLAHTEGFGDRAGVVREKASLAACVRAGGAVVAPARDSELLAAVRKRAPSDARIVTVGDAPGADAQLLCAAQRLVEENGQLRPQLTAALADGAELTLPLAGRHNALNACFALAAARALGVEDQTACAAMKGMAPAPMRLAFSRVGGVLLCNDAYNANPASTLAAIETFLELTTQAAQRTLVLGDLLELGACAAEAVEQVAPALRRFDRVVACGELACAMAQRAAALGLEERWIERHPEGLTDDGAAAVAQRLGPGEAALLKGSRACGLERVEHALRAAGGGD